ncbi:discoidin domain-containing receptor 2 [Plakobranchus ocellatus]|uniref:Discoidin domain-containing receptor 2 n=1 Tax=Plakobranchus ocellatus TaxID=259542 RepID=A0AAV4DZC3_9GAST|nr:discoidin domain-containing receptor 2 [Plakobranchus ocellatus]
MEFVTHYSLEYQRDEEEKWRRHRGVYGDEIFTGNRDVYTADVREVDPPIIAKKIRFIPYSELPRTVCMRVEMYGCVWEDELLSYSMPQGHRRGSDLDLSDWTFDGYIETNKTTITNRRPSSATSPNGRGIALRPPKQGKSRDDKDRYENEYLRDGLGQLTDGQIGETNFRLVKEKRNFKGYEWVGWKNDSMGGKPLTIYFKFDSVRNFSHMLLHVNNHFNKDVHIFRRADIFYSIGGKYYQSEPTRVDFQPDEVFEDARMVTLKMEHKIGKFLKINFFFQARWIMISELSFVSDKAVGNFVEETPPPTTLAPPNKPKSTRKSNVFDTNNNGRTGGSKPDREFTKADNFDAGETEGSSDKTGYTNDDNDKDTLVTPKKEENDGNDYISIIIGVLAALVFLLFAVVLIFFCRHKRRKNNNNGRGSSSVSSTSSANGRVLKPVGNNHVAINLNDIRSSNNGKVSNGNMYNSIATDEADSDRDASAGGCCNGGGSAGSVSGSGSGKYGCKPAYVQPKDTIQGRQITSCIACLLI